METKTTTLQRELGSYKELEDLRLRFQTFKTRAIANGSVSITVEMPLRIDEIEWFIASLAQAEACWKKNNWPAAYV
jgi:hypothetical protein